MSQSVSKVSLIPQVRVSSSQTGAKKTEKVLKDICTVQVLVISTFPCIPTVKWNRDNDNRTRFEAFNEV